MKAKFREKICYCIGAMGYEFEAGIVIAYMTLFCTDIMHISPAILGFLVFGTKVLDALSDVVITNVADKTHTRFGKYRTWILSGIPLAVMFLLFFLRPDFLENQSATIFYICAVYILMVPVCETAYMCPMVVMGTVMSRDPGDRLDFATARSLGENIADLITNAACMTIILSFGSYRDIAGWRIMGLLFAICIASCSFIGFLGTRERVLPDNKDGNGKTLTFKEKIKTLFSNNPSYIRLLFIQFGLHISWTVSMVLFNYFCINNLGHEDWVAVLSTIGVIAQMCATFMVSYLGRHMELRSIIFAGCLLLATGALILMFADSFATCLAYQLFKGVGIGLLFVSTWSSLPQMTELVEYKTGIAIPGMVMAVVSFGMKVNVALGNLFSTQVLNLGGYDSYAKVQSAATLSWIRFGCVFFILTGVIIVTAANFGLRDLSRKKVAMYTKSNEERRISLQNG